jgi:aminoglycoside phosphotransferase (APT) family kinase protein
MQDHERARAPNRHQSVTPQPWDADRPLTLEIAAAVIAACFPSIDSRGLEYLGSGWDFDAYVTTDGWVFRFPRRAACAEHLDTEARVQQLVGRAMPPGIVVPSIELVGDPVPDFPYPFTGHRFVAGVGADALESDPSPALGRDIAAALGAIHTIPADAARSTGVWEVEADDLATSDWLLRGLAEAPRLRGFDPTVDRALDWASRVSLPGPMFEGPARLIHQDLSPDHLIVDPATGRLAGIIDWSDAMLGDPARDFVFLVTWQGWDYANEVIRSYRVPVDRGFRERLDFMARILSVVWLAHAREQEADVQMQVRQVHNAFEDPAGQKVLKRG